MISSTDLSTILEHNSNLSGDGRAILAHALTLQKPFTVFPSHLERQLLTALTEKGVEVVAISPVDFAAICKKPEEKEIKNLKAEGWMVAVTMNVYPDEQFE